MPAEPEDGRLPPAGAPPTVPGATSFAGGRPGAAPETEEDPRLVAVESWFLSRGLPHFIDGYSASRDVFTRTLPVLIAVVVVELVVVLEAALPLVLNVAVGLASLATLVGVWVAVNLARKRPALARPEDVEALELTVFVLLAPAVALVLAAAADGRPATAVELLAVNLALLGLVYLTTSYGLLPMTRWAARRLLRGVHELFGLVVRVLPLLLLFVLFLFFTAETWEAAATLDGPFLPAVVALFTLLGASFILGRLPREVGSLGRFSSARELRHLAAGTPAAALLSAFPEDSPDEVVSPPLNRRQWGNIGLVLVFSQGVLVVLASLLIAAFLVAFGVLAVSPDVVRSWTGGDVTTLVELDLWGRTVAVTVELVQVSALLAAISGFSFTLSLLTDTTYRGELVEDVLDEVREALAVRAVYLVAMPPAGGGAMPPAGGGAMPPAGGGAMPPAGEGAMPPAGGGAMPPAGEGAAMPPAGGAGAEPGR